MLYAIELRNANEDVMNVVQLLMHKGVINSLNDDCLPLIRLHFA